MSRFLAVVLALTTLVGGAASVMAAPAAAEGVTLVIPANVVAGESFAFEFRLPSKVAAVDGRLFLDTTIAEVVGLAPVGGGTALEPIEISGGVAFGAYGLNAKKGHTSMRVVVAPQADAQLEFRIVIDATADALGNRIAINGNKAVGKIKVGKAGTLSATPKDDSDKKPPHNASSNLVQPIADGAYDKEDLDVVRAAWSAARLNDDACDVARYIDADANRDGCVDIADIQAVAARLGTATTTIGKAAAAFDPQAAAAADTRFTASVGQPIVAPMTAVAGVASSTFVVNSTADTVDSNKGNGICADSSGFCTLRAAITEANWMAGDNRIEFNLPGSAPVVIQLSSTPMSLIQDRTGSLVIDGYSQPGSAVNTASIGSNAVMGIELRGTGDTPRGYSLFVSSANNTIRGISFTNAYRGVFMDGADAHHNSIVGNFFGFDSDGTPQDYQNAYTNIVMNNGAHDNQVGRPAIADRNVAGRARKSVYMYGSGTNNNLIQNNLLCQTPSGQQASTCYIGVDHDFGPKFNQTGGLGANEKNVIGPTFLQGIEISHGWDPDTGDGSEPYQVNSNRLLGNWVGFKADGSYAASFRSGQNNPGNGDSGNSINVHDGSNFNLIEGNYVASVYDGIQTMSSNSTGQVIRGNTVGVSPLGQAAPLTRDGIVVRQHSRSHIIENNIIRNTGRYGVALRAHDVLWVRVSQNIITDTPSVAIFLQPDPDDPTKGADNLQPSPVVTSATTLHAQGTGEAGATVEVYRATRPAGQRGLPAEYLGSTLVDGTGHWNLPISVNVGDRVSALQIAPNNNTSNVSLNVSATFEEPADPPIADFDYEQQPGVLEVQFTDTSANEPSSWTWNFGDGQTSHEQNPSHTYENPGSYQVKLTAGNSGGNDDTTETVNVAPVSAVVFASDLFERIVANGWGTADQGGAYAVESTASNYSVANGVGTLTVPSTGKTRSARLDGINRQNIDIRFKVAANKVLSGGPMYVYAVARKNGTSEYRPRLVLKADGGVAVGASVLINGAESTLGPQVNVAGLSQVAGSFIWVRAEVDGINPTRIRVKAWADGQSEPSGWHFTATNSQASLQGPGSVGLRSYLATGANAPVTLSFDNYRVASVMSSSNVVSDEFIRNVASAWGSADTGGTYTMESGADNYAVNNGVGKMTVNQAGKSRAARLDGINKRDINIRFRVTADKVLAGGNLFVYAFGRRSGTSEYRPRVVFNGNGTISAGASVVVNGTESALGPSVVVPGLTQSANSFLWVRAEITGASPTTIRVKVWADGQSEPADWNFSVTNSQAALQGPGSVGLRTYLGTGGANAPVTLSFDDYTVTATQ